MASHYRAPAKINLTLEVLSRRDDGYHTLRSVMVPLELADEIAIEPNDRFELVCDLAELTGDENLATRAARALGRLPAARIVLHKQIPIQAGLGGGSSDAAAVLRAAMDGVFGPPPELDWLGRPGRWDRTCRFLAGTGALVEGTGERVTPAGALPRWHVLIVKPPTHLPTAAAYAELDRTARPSRPRAASVSIELLTALQRHDFAGVERRLSNDFQTPIAQVRAEVAAALDALRAAGATNALLAGSGSSVFTLADERATIERIAERLALPRDYRRYVTAFAATPDWRS